MTVNDLGSVSHTVSGFEEEGNIVYVQEVEEVEVSALCFVVLVFESLKHLYFGVLKFHFFLRVCETARPLA
jgi:hypothetical protein